DAFTGRFAICTTAAPSRSVVVTRSDIQLSHVSSGPYCSDRESALFCRAGVWTVFLIGREAVDAVGDSAWRPVRRGPSGAGPEGPGHPRAMAPGRVPECPEPELLHEDR